MMFRRWRVKRAAPGRYRLQLPAEERQLLASLADQLRELLTTGASPDDERMRRVFPTAYADDPERDAEYQRFMHEELVTSHLGALDALTGTLEHQELSEAEVHRWVQSLNAVRLVLGTMLDVSEEDDPMDFDDPGHVLYGYLSGLLEEMIQALSA